jgi:hypothetical protein
MAPAAGGLLDDQQRLAELDRLAVPDHDAYYLAGAGWPEGSSPSWLR